ncbi:MAG: 30S ribosomal protein S3 [Clostridiales bacterium]|nr:30S ribosomal protein S3 [Clostridiales bacterium]
MGQKVNPHGARVGVIMDWSAKWYADKKNFSKNLVGDYKLRNWLKDKLNAAGISHIDLARAGDKMDVNVWTAKPGIIIGKGGANVETLKQEIAAYAGVASVNLNILEVKNPECDAQLVAENIAQQIEKRVSFRRAMKQVISHAMKAGAQGIKTTVSGRLGGADIARSEGYHEGSIPLQTLRANIDYGFAEAHTTYGRIGVKVWVYKGQFLGKGYAPRSVKATGNRREGREGRDGRDFRDRGPRQPRENRTPNTNTQEGGK